MRAFIGKATKDEVIIRVQGVKNSIYYKAEKGEKFNFRASNLSNILLLTAFPIAMKKGLDLEVTGDFDHVLVKNLLKVSNLWYQLRPDKFSKPVRIIVTPESERKVADSFDHVSNRKTSVMAFSGGVDSTYAFLNNNNNPAGNVVDFCVMINGFGYNLKEDSEYNSQYDKNRNFLESKNVSLCSVKTNYKQVVAWYPLFHTMGISAVLNLFGKDYNIGSIGLDYTFKEERMLGPWGNLTLLDMLYSSSDFLIDPIGGDRNRIQKIKYLDDNNALHYVTVCNNIEKYGKNCGSCDKCIRTMLMYDVNGIDPSESFIGELNEDKLKGIKIQKNTQYVFYLSLLESMPADHIYRSYVENSIKAYKSLCKIQRA